jgi:hypothetical protein
MGNWGPRRRSAGPIPPRPGAQGALDAAGVGIAVDGTDRAVFDHAHHRATYGTHAAYAVNSFFHWVPPGKDAHLSAWNFNVKPSIALGPGKKKTVVKKETFQKRRALRTPEKNVNEKTWGPPLTFLVKADLKRQ